MRITFICDVFYPSSESTSQLFAELLNRLAADGLHCHVIANRLPNLRQRLATASPLDPKITVRRVGIPMLGRSSLLLRAVRYLAFASGASMHLLLTRADRLWGGTNPPFTPILLAAVAALRRKPFDIIIHDVYPDGLVAVGFLREESLVTRGWRWLNGWAYRRANRVVVLGRDMAALMQRRYRVRDSQLVMFPNWSPFDQATPLPLTASSLAQRLDLTKRFVVQYSGNMGLWHDIETLVRAAKLLSSDERIHFLMIGEGRRRNAAQQLAINLGITNMTWQDFQNRNALSDSLACSSVALISQRAGLEGVAVPCKLYGILASGRAIVAAVPAESEVAKVVGEEHCGVVVSPSDPLAVAEAIRRLADDDSLTAGMGACSFAAYGEKYSLAAAATRFWRTWGTWGTCHDDR